MKTNSKWRSALFCGVVAITGQSSAKAQTSLKFHAFETSGVSNLSHLDYIDLEALIVASGNGVSIKVRNTSVIGNPGVTPGQPTVTKIFFEDQTSVLGSAATITGSVGQVVFVGDGNLNLPGGNNIDFIIDSAFRAVPPPTLYGVDPGESITFQFNHTSYDALIDSLVDGDFRIAMHVQQIGLNGADSAAFVNKTPVPSHTVPEPTSAMLGLLGSLMLLRRRR